MLPLTIEYGEMKKTGKLERCVGYQDNIISLTYSSNECLIQLNTKSCLNQTIITFIASVDLVWEI